MSNATLAIKVVLERSTYTGMEHMFYLIQEKAEIDWNEIWVVMFGEEMQVSNATSHVPKFRMRIIQIGLV